MMATSRVCSNNPDLFCYVCGSYCILKSSLPISDNVIDWYKRYFKIEIKHQSKSWAPHRVCKTCYTTLSRWTQGTRHLKFGRPMIWREPTNHIDDCYFCLTDVKKLGKKTVKYPQVSSVSFPVPHSDTVPVPTYFEIDESGDKSDNFSNDFNEGDDDTDYDDSNDEGNNTSSCQPESFNQQEINDLARDLGLSKELSELLASRLDEKRLLEKNTSITYFRKREGEFLQYFKKEKDFVYCTDIKGLLISLGLREYNTNEWRLFLDSNKRSLKCVLLHNGNEYSAIPIAHSIKQKEEYSCIQLILELLNYNEHQWIICVDLKMVNFLLGQQSGFTKFPCFICLWDSRDRANHWIKKSWPRRNNLIKGDANIINDPLVPRSKIVFPPLHIKLGLMKQFVKALDTNNACFNYIVAAFPALTSEKIKAGIFDGPQIRKLVHDPDFQKTMTPVELEAWISFVQVIEHFLGNMRAENYKDIVSNMLENFRKLGCNMSIKVHFLHSHLSEFPTNCGAVSDEQGERFHQDLKVIEQRYQGRWDDSMMADYCWTIKRDIPDAVHKKKSLKRKFLP